jgi:hypothetical protein
MDRVESYRAIIRRIIAEQAAVQPAAGNVELVPVCDDMSGHYLVLMVGWDGYDRIDAPVIHIRLHEGKVWLEEDNTDAQVADQLLEAGIPQEAIVLAFQHPTERTPMTSVPA